MIPPASPDIASAFSFGSPNAIGLPEWTRSDPAPSVGQQATRPGVAKAAYGKQTPPRLPGTAL